MTRISDETRNSILSLIDTGLSSRKIGAQLGVSYRTVSRVRAEARPGIQKCRAGRPAKLTATDKRWLVRRITSGKAANAVQATRQLSETTNVKVNCNTTRRALKDAGLKAGHRKKNRDFCRGISASALPLPRDIGTGP